eukprot:gene1233-15603_t
MSMDRDICNKEFDFGALDVEMADLRGDFEKYAPSEQKEFGFGVSPSYSSDSGVDNIEEDLFRFYYDGLNNGGEFGRLVNDELCPDTLDAFSKENADFGTVLGLDGSGSSWEEAGEDKVKGAINEDHCYTSSKWLNDLIALDGNNEQNEGCLMSSSRKAEISKDLKSLREPPKFLEHKRKIKESKIPEDIDDATSEKCSNRNAIMARLNRQRKKRYVSNLESEVNNLRKQNAGLLAENSDLKVKVTKYFEEMEYLKGVIENQSMLSTVIKAVASAPGIKLKGVVPFTNKAGDTQADASDAIDTTKGSCSTSSVSAVKHSQDHSIPKMAAKNKGGICVHVQEENVSIAFCHHCSSHADSVMTS